MYINARTKVRLRHKECGYEWDANPHGFLDCSSRCPRCSAERSGIRSRKPKEEVEKRLSSIVGDEYSIIGEYINSNTKVKVRHNKCGHEWDVIVNSIIHGTRCPSCYKQRVTKSDKDFSEYVKTQTNSEYTVITEYKTAKIPITIKHNKCGYEWSVTPNHFMAGYRCPKCNPKAQKSHQQFSDEVQALVGNEYTLVSKYKNSLTKVTIKHNKCGTIYDVMPGSFLNGNRCPKCNISKGEKFIEATLKKLNVKYEAQYRIDNCRNVKPLPFDFAVFNKDGELSLLIEFNGVQHYEPQHFFGGEEEFERRIHNDKLKKSYCKRHKIQLCVIPYTSHDMIPIILKERLSNLL
jgi:predicted Zn-ribbon and HTH transcriptional regulator